AWSARDRLRPTSPEADALFLYVSACAPDGVAGPPLRDAARAVADRGEPSRTSGGGARPSSAPDPDAPDLATPREAALERIREAPPAPAHAGPRQTPFGGAFLLLPVLDALPLSEATADWPDADGTPADALARLLILVKCLGP